MRFFLAGGAGEVGRHLAEYYLKGGNEVVVYDRSADNLLIVRHPGLTVIQGDLEDKELLQSLILNGDIVINLAWSFADNAAALFRDDIAGHINLLDVAVGAGARRFIYTSTAAVYGTPQAELVSEEHPCLVQRARKPLYAVAKFSAEQLCHVYQMEKGLPITVLRFWWAFGKTIGGKHLRNIVTAAINNEPIKITRSAGGSFVSMEDLAAAILLSVQKDCTNNGVYNIGSLFLTWSDIVSLITEMTGSHSPVIELSPEEWEGPAFLQERWYLNWGKANNEIGYKPIRSKDAMRTNFRSALARLTI